MAFLFSGKNKTIKSEIGISADYGLSLVLDIESGLVRGALVSNTSGAAGVSGAPIVRYTSESLIKNAPHEDSAAMTEMMLRALREVTDDIANKGMPTLPADLPAKEKVINKMHYVLSSPWVISKTKTVTVKYPKDTDISRANINDILSAEHKELEEKFKTDHSDSTFIEEKIFEIKLNGYPVTHIEGKKARELSLSFALTVGSKSVLASMRDIITSALHVRTQDQECHSSLLLQYAAFRNLITARNDYIAAHVHHELSDIIVVKGGVCSIMASFPFGSATFMREVSDTVKQSAPLTSSVLSMNAENNLDYGSAKEISAASDPVVSEWASQFWKTLSMAGDKQTLPRFLFLSVHDHYPYFEEALRREATKDSTEESLDITPLDEAMLEKAVSFTRPEDQNALVGMYAYALNPALKSSIM